MDIGGQHPPRPTPQEIAEQTDALLWTLAREDVLVSRLVGKALVRLAALDGFAALGFSCLENYAAQQLGISGRSAQELAWMERRLQRYPALDDAYEGGRLGFSQVRLLLRLVRPEDEKHWAETAPRMSVAELEQALAEWKAAGRSPACDDETAGAYPLRAPEEEAKPHRIRFFATPSQIIKFELAVELIRREHGANLPAGACFEFMMAEFLGGPGHSALATAGVDDSFSDDVPGEVLPWRVPGAGAIRRMWREVKLGIAEMTDHWSALCWEIAPIPGPEGVAHRHDPADVDRHLRSVLQRRHVREVHLMNLLAIMRDNHLFEFLDFTGLTHYVEDRLMMSPRTAWTLVSIHRRTWRLPALRQAYEDGTLTGAQVLLAAKVACEDTEAEWIEHARRTTLKFLRQDVAAAERMRDLDQGSFALTGGLPEEERGYEDTRLDTARVHACAPTPDEDEEADAPSAADVSRRPVGELLRMSGRGDLDEIDDDRRQPQQIVLPHALVEMWRDVVRACQVIYGTFVSIADCIEACVDAYLEEHRRAALASIRQHKIHERDGWVCANPTCTRRAMLHEHHLQFRSHGGSEAPENRLTLCRMCHLRLVHQGHIRVQGNAPNDLRWDLGLAPGRAPNLRVTGRHIVGGEAAPPVAAVEAAPVW